MGRVLPYTTKNNISTETQKQHQCAAKISTLVSAINDNYHKKGAVQWKGENIIFQIFDFSLITNNFQNVSYAFTEQKKASSNHHTIKTEELVYVCALEHGNGDNEIRWNKQLQT